jgi:hypothetical protein
MIARIALGLTVSIALCFAIGCSKSSTTQASSESSSDSSSSPFRSSSKSSSGDDEDGEKEEEKETAYQRDVRDYTAEFAQSADGRDIESFQRGLGEIAEGFGITDWERTEDTFVAIGRGLRESELDDEDAKQIAVALSNEDYDHLMLIRSGLESRRKK